MNLIASFVRLTQEFYGARHITLRAAVGNASTMYFGKNASEETGFLEPGDSVDFWNVSPRNIWVKGATTDCVFWHGDEA
jgi:hypothetical protein